MLYLINLPEVFNTTDISTFIKDHRDTKIYLNFYDDLTDEYKHQLDALIDTVIEVAVPKCLIYYAGQNEEKLEKARYPG
uniref:Uncharacterized protein n=1 Tax=Panagrolaimus sp. ES5 TaxID=591445 RepID=A0AC34FXP1_9BILA